MTNIGSRARSDVVQLYVRPIGTTVDRPEKELRAFRKLHLAAKTTDTVTLGVTLRDLAYYDVEAKAFIALAGDYELVIAAHALDIRGTVRITLPNTWLEPALPAPLRI
ncbi:fibronectin type III-like domain-contianing protein [Agrobacterium tumefaciens]|uniref:fibronectin type III-like domain-contianing protein n=1 Tax=Agrobacterium tumefaciens TaxID=358 RepID=UPI002FDC426A